MPKKVSPTLVLVSLSALLIIIFGGLWWRSIYSDPERVFKAMLDNSLRLTSVSKEVNQTGNGQEVRQFVDLEFGPEHRVLSRTLLTQLGDTPTTVETESIGTPTTDYVRYIDIDTEQTKPSGEPLDFSGVLGIWGSSDVDQPDATTNGELYNESILGIVPFGVFDQAQRRELLKLIEDENIYEVDYSAVSKEIQDGRPRYIYSLTVDAEAYIKLLKRFGELHGLNHLSELDPAAYAGQERLPFVITADVWSRQLERIEYSAGDRIETFGSHNAVRGIELPAQVVSVDEIQSRLQALQQ